MNIYAVILAAGKGTRMKSDKPKVLHEVLYKPMVQHVIDELKKLGVTQIVTVVGHRAEMVKEVLKNENVDFALQAQQLGTGHAVLQASELLEGKEGLTLVLNGDAPLIRKETLQRLIQTHVDGGHHATMMTCNLPITTPFGRVIRDESGNVRCITEYKDATEQERLITEMNVGEYCFDNQYLFDALRQIKSENAQHEYYITDLATVMNGMGLKVGTCMIENFDEVGGINDRVALAESEEILKLRINKEHLLNGVGIMDIHNTYIGRDVIIGEETIIEPGCVIKGNTVIGKRCHIGPYTQLDHAIIEDDVMIQYSSISDSTVKRGTDIGPYARLRNGCIIREGVHIGNFVEMKKTDFGAHSKCAHLSYLGDAVVGENVNIGCGTITCNYDGANKFQTIIKDNAFIGCNSNLVAPVTVEENGFVGAGSTITNDVPSDAFAIARARQVNKEGYASVLKEKRDEIKKNRNKN